MAKHIMFDFDGTLVDSRDLVLKLYNEIALQHGFRAIYDVDIPFLRSLPIADRCRWLGIPLYKIPQLAVQAKKSYQSIIPSLHMVPGIRETVHQLVELGYSLSILSSNSGENIRLFLKRNEISVFGHIYSVNNLFGKHHTIKQVLRKRGMRSKDVLYIGDEVRDIEACKKLDVPIIAVTWGYDSISLLSNAYPDFLVKEPRDIIAFVKAKKPS
jgi:phosphoglycolate phosphatase